MFRNLLPDLNRLINPWSKERRIARAIKADPEILEALKLNIGNRFPSKENQMPVYNTARSMNNVCENKSGFCRGHSGFRQAATLLAFYDPNSEFSKAPKAPEGSYEWIKFYVGIIEDLAALKPRFVPGFANMKEFTGHPALIDYVKREIALSLAKHNAHLSSLPIFLNRSDSSVADSHQFVKDLNERLALGYNPKIIFDYNTHALVEDDHTTIHVPLALGTYKLKGNKTAVLVWDDKHAWPNGLEYLIINHNSGRAFYWTWKYAQWSDGSTTQYDMGGGFVEKYRIAPEDAHEVNEMAYNLDRFCRENPEGCTALAAWKERKTPKPALKQAGHPFDKFEFLKTK